MPVQTISAPLAVGAAASHQVTIAATGTPTANFLTIVVPDTTANDVIIVALENAIQACRTDPVRFRG